MMTANNVWMLHIVIFAVIFGVQAVILGGASLLRWWLRRAWPERELPLGRPVALRWKRLRQEAAHVGGSLQREPGMESRNAISPTLV